ncbi:MAG: hypothetical protein IKE56_09025 [Lachnospiraceae bacterium]|nr:hypothetical protein [Lachnospiraceae bacterium]
MGRVLRLCRPEAERGVGYELLIQRLEKTGPFQAEGFGDLLLEGPAERGPRHACECKLCQRDAAAGIHVLPAVRTDPSELRRIALSVQHVLERERLVICAVAGEAVQVVI